LNSTVPTVPTATYNIIKKGNHNLPTLKQDISIVIVKFHTTTSKFVKLNILDIHILKLKCCMNVFLKIILKNHLLSLFFKLALSLKIATNNFRVIFTLDRILFFTL